LEILRHHDYRNELASEISTWLLLRAEAEISLQKLIKDGLALIENPAIDLTI
jgi:hypothetical protein